jgi:hypothetical protein
VQGFFLKSTLTVIAIAGSFVIVKQKHKVEYVFCGISTRYGRIYMFVDNLPIKQYDAEL